MSTNDIVEARHTSLIRHSGLANASRVRSQHYPPLLESDVLALPRSKSIKNADSDD